MTSCEESAGYWDGYSQDPGGGKWPKTYPIWFDSVQCPANSQPSGANECGCSPGFTQANGECQTANAERDACSSWGTANGVPGGALTSIYRLPGKISEGAVYCMPGAFPDDSKGCKVVFTPDPTIPWMDYGGGKVISEGTFSMSPDRYSVDQSCTPGTGESPDKVPEKEKCSSGYTGTVNGVEVCVKKVPDSGVEGGKTETETKNGDNTVKEVKDTKTECKNGVCTTTTTTTTTTTNTTTNTTTTNTTTNTTSDGKGSFCEQNKGSKLCGDGDDKGSSFGGSCSAGFKCEGDAIQCAIAQEQHRRDCKLFDDSSAESDLYNANKAKTGNQTTELPGNETISLAGRIDTSDALGGGGCFGDLSVTVWNTSVSLPLSNLCQYLAMLGNILVAVSMLMAARIVTRG